MSDAVLVQTNKEKEELDELFDLKDKYCKRIVIGADASVFADAKCDDFKNHLINSNLVIAEKNLILNVGRIEPRKNQLSLIQAFNSLNASEKHEDIALVFVGANNKNHGEYFRRFLKEVESNKKVYYLGVLPQKIVASAMAYSKLYATTSWFETTGLTNIEAYMSGTPVVSTVKRLAEFIDNYIVFCEPNDTNSIARALKQGLNMRKPPKEEIKKVSDMLDWRVTAKQTVEVYEHLLK